MFFCTLNKPTLVDCGFLGILVVDLAYM